MTEQQNVYIYIREWEFKSQPDRELFGDQPTPGRVYAASIDPETLTVRISIPEGNHRARGIQGIMVHNFQGDNDRWKYSFEEVNEKNISSLGIKDEDFKLIMSGIPTQDDKLGVFDDDKPSLNDDKIRIELHSLDPIKEAAMDLLGSVSMEMLSKMKLSGLDQVRDKAISAMVEIENTDEDMLDTLSEVLAFIADTYKEDGDAEIFTQAMTLVGMNSAEATTTLMFNALTLLSRYAQSAKKGQSPDPELLKSAIFLICIEILQRKRNTENGNQHN